ncbi:MAG: bifunctional adenosylcobinamide kinase/adenosylcobinamide-phosphate guanylyltransferase, partial [Planctomycetota bacterium]
MARIVMAAGASRSGKSTWAEARLAPRRRVGYFATLQVLDDELRDRVDRHRRRRPAAWTTIEAPDRLVEAVRDLPAEHDGILVDCLTGFLGNRLAAAAPEDGPVAPAAIDEILA